MNSDPGTPPPDRPPPFTNLQAIIDQLNRTVQAQDFLRTRRAPPRHLRGARSCSASSSAPAAA